MASVWKVAVPSKKFRSGVCWHLRWREGGRTRGRSLKTGSASKADAAVSAKRSEMLKDAAEAGTLPAAGARPLDALAGYLRGCEARGLAERTVSQYRRLLTPLAERYAHTPLPQWTRPMLEAHLAELTCGPATKGKVLSAARTWRGWCLDSGIDCADFPGRLRIRRPPARRRTVLTIDEVEAVLDAARASPRTAKYELPIALAAYAGLALSDVRALDWDEVDLDGRWIVRQRRKTGEHVEVWIATPLLERLRRHRASSGPVCLGMAESRSSLGKTLRRIQARAGIPPAPAGQNGWHRYRHTYATLIMRAGASGAEVSRALGHAPQSDATKLYQHPDLADVQATIERTFG